MFRGHILAQALKCSKQKLKVNIKCDDNESLDKIIDLKLFHVQKIKNKLNKIDISSA